MNIISNFVVSDILKMLEEQFIANEPQLQQAFLDEVSVLARGIGQWLTTKISGEVTDEKK